jgi:hypothetical protein
MAAYGFCAPARHGATCRPDSAIGIRCSCASRAGASNPLAGLPRVQLRDTALESTAGHLHVHWPQRFQPLWKPIRAVLSSVSTLTGRLQGGVTSPYESAFGPPLTGWEPVRFCPRVASRGISVARRRCRSMDGRWIQPALSRIVRYSEPDCRTREARGSCIRIGEDL